MYTLLIVGCLILLLLLAAVVLFFAGVIKQNKRLMIALFFVLGTTTFLGLLLGGLLLYRGSQFVAQFLKPRDGEEIYYVLMGQPAPCVRVIHSQDQVIPKIDYAIWLEAEICEAEFKRIIPAVPYKVISGDINHNGPEWFLKGALSDSLEVYENLDSYGNGRIYYVTRAHTHLFLKDIAD